MKTNRYKVVVAYNGCNYHGWEIQPHCLTIQKIIQDCFFQALKQKVKIYAAGRTDAGVNALGQVFHFDLIQKIKLTNKKIIHLINKILPYDIKILKINKVKNNFNARFDAKRKIYQYFINCHPIPNPILANSIYQYNKPINIIGLKKIKNLFIGTKNFLSFSTDARKDKEILVKTIKSIKITKKNFVVKFEICGNSFLRSMIRMIIGCFLAYNEKKIDLKMIKDCFKNPQKGKCTYKAPACGLTLFKIFY